MKYMYAALLGLGLLSGTLMQAKEEVKKTHIIKKKPSVYKKTTKPKAKPANVQAKKAQSHKIKSKPKKQVYKNVTKRAVNPATTTAATSANPATEPVASAPKATDETAYQKLTNWISGIGGAGAGTSAAAKQALIGHHRTAGYHTGPRKEKWNHPFESWWGKRGFEEGINANGHWVFGSYRPAWWQKNYPTYWKDVVGPLYRQSAEYKAAVAQIGK